MSREIRHQTSLVLNIVLAVAAVAMALYRPESTPAPTVKMANETPAPSLTPALPRKTPRYAEMTSASDQRRWLVDQLRSMGVPNNILARVVQADLDAAWTRHAAEVTLKCHGDSDTMAALQLEIDMSADADMRAALGEDGFKQWDHANMLREADQGKISLTPTETEATYNLWKKYQQRELDLKQARVKAEMDESDIESEHEQAYAEFHQQMKNLLGDERYAQSQQTDDGTAVASLRQDLAKANPTDSQFQDLLKVQQQLNEQRSALDKQFQDQPSSTAYVDQIKALDAARDQEYQKVLGTNVFDTFQKEQDIGYTRMKKYEEIWGLDDNSINQVYGAMKYYQKNAQDYQARARALETQGQTVDWETVKKNLQQFASQTQQALQNYLGPDRYNRMQQNGVFQFNQSPVFQK